MRSDRINVAILAAVAAAFMRVDAAHAAVPITDLGTGLYLNQYQGGLYPGGSNAMPGVHAAAGMSRVGSITPINTQGQPDPSGKFVMLSIGMSNTTQEFNGTGDPAVGAPYSFMGQAAAHPAVNRSSMVLFDGAAGGQTAATWDQPTDVNYDRVRTNLLNNGLSEAQVRVAWVKVANSQPMSSLPNANADANALVLHMGNIARTLKQRYPNIQMVYLSSRIYAGYATTPLNPEPYAYESGFAVKRVIAAQVNQMNGGAPDPVAGNLDYSTGTVPWLAWGPYMWADGANPRGGDGLTWLPTDFVADGTHPSLAGRQKVGTLLMRHFVNSPFTRDWFRDFGYGDADTDGSVGFDDYALVDAGFLNNRTGWSNGDFDYSGRVDFDDYALIDAAFTAQTGAVGRAVAWLGGAPDPMDDPALKFVAAHYADFGQPYAQAFLSAVPEPAAMLTFVAAAIGMMARHRRGSVV